MHNDMLQVRVAFARVACKRLLCVLRQFTNVL